MTYTTKRYKPPIGTSDAVHRANRKAPGRPRLDDSQKHQCCIKVSYTKNEMETVNYLAETAGRKPHQYVHDASLKAKVTAHISDEQIEMVRSLVRMGNNFNQLVRKINANVLSPFANVCQETVNMLSTLIARILRGGDLTKE